MLKFLVLILPFVCIASAPIEFSCASTLAEISVDTLFSHGTEYHLVFAEGYTVDGGVHAGLPSIPWTSATFLLPPELQLESVLTVTATWDSLPGKYYLYPVQSGFLSDTLFQTPDAAVYNSNAPFPLQPVEISRQGSAMGFSAVTLSGSPVRYIPADSTILILTSISLDMVTGPAEFEGIIPNRETCWSAETRNRGIFSLVSNPGEVSGYSSPEIQSFTGRSYALNISQSPSSAGDGVDMVIITSNELADEFELFADFRTQQGIVTVVRTVEWIDNFYSGCDTQERIRNFIRDAHLEWGIQAVILGGDSDVVPIRECNGWDYMPGPFPSYQLPLDDYYSDIDGDWSYDGTNWRVDPSGGYLDLCVGRWPVNSANDVASFFNKILVYEQPDEIQENFARRILLIGSNNPAGTGADDVMELEEQLLQSSAVPMHLDPPYTLLYPHSLPGGDLCRSSALDEFDQGYNLVIHADHSEVHKLATAGNGTLGQYIWDSDFSTMNNINQPSILWTLGCETGHFDGAYCFSEAGLLTSENSGLVAVMSNARGGFHYQIITAYALCDALFNTGWIAAQQQLRSLHWPLSFLGEAYRCSKNVTDVSFIHLNLLGSPLMYVWRDDPHRLLLSVPALLLREGVPQDITVTVTDGSDPVENVTVCLWKKDEIFSLLETNPLGQVTFSGVCIADGTEDLVITAVKRRIQVNPAETTTVDYIAGRTTIDVLPANVPIITLESFDVDPDGDGTANPGETVDIQLTALNSGGTIGSGVSAEISLVSGEEFIESIVNNQTDFPDIAPDNTEESTDPITIQISSGVPDYTTIEFNLSFTYSSGSDTLQWNSPLFLTVYSESYALTVMSSAVDNSSGRTAEINLSNMLLVNCGLGAGTDLAVTVSNIFPDEPSNVNILTHQGIESNTASDLSGQLILFVHPESPGSRWLKPGFRDCSFDITVSSNGGDFTARNIDVEMIADQQSFDLSPPVNLSTYQTGEDYISLTWEHSGDVEASGFYIYCDDGIEKYRVFPLPVPVKQITVNGLVPGRNYQIEVTAVDIIGRESEPVSVSASTTCPLVDGWPLYLDGSPGGGPAIADIDGDGYDEIIAATSFGIVYLIEKDGSSQRLYPPQGFDFDRFLGCAVGDVDADSQMEIIVSCQRKIETQDQEQVAILLFDGFNGLWTVSEIAATNVNEEVSSPNIAGTPVLFQADSDSRLEIALRTRGSNGGDPHLYAWKYDTVRSSWVNYSSDFPLYASGGFYNSPVAIDFDEDGLQELVLTVMGTGAAGTALLVADFNNSGDVTVTQHNLPELDTDGELARAFGSLAAAEQNGTYYIAGAAKVDAMSGVVKKIWVFEIDSEPDVSVSFVWQTEWLTGYDAYGNMPGPAIGNLDSDPELEVIYSLNCGLFNSEGYTAAWDLTDGYPDFQSDAIPFNPILGGGGSSIRSQPVTGLTTIPGSGESAVFSGFSSLCCGHDPQSGTSMISGFPTGTRDGAWAAPAICDLDNDGTAEILYIDYSGFASLFNFQQSFYTQAGWHMYQDNPQRTGFYNTNNRRECIDIRVSGLPSLSESTLSRPESSNLCILAEIDITGSREADNRTSCNTNASIPLTSSRHPVNTTATSSAAIEPVNTGATVLVAAFSSGTLIGTGMTSLEDGLHTVTIPLPFRTDLIGDITVIADPFNEYAESDETNNTSELAATGVPGANLSVSIPSPSESIELHLQLPEPLASGLNITVYSIDGRVVINRTIQELQAGITNVSVNTGTHRNLPAGMYTVCIQGPGFQAVTKKIIILSR